MIGWTRIAIIAALIAMPLRAQSFLALMQEADQADVIGAKAKSAKLYEQAYSVSGGEISIRYLAAREYAMAGKKAEAFRNLDLAVEGCWEKLGEIEGDAAMASLQDDPRWEKVLAAAEARMAKFDQDLRKELLDLAAKDQENRKGLSEIVATHGRSSPEGEAAFGDLKKKDEPLLARAREIISQHGWPGCSLVADDGSHAAWLLVQHMDVKYQTEVLPALQAAAQRGEARKADVAYLRDRILMTQGKPQIYGTQLHYDDAAGRAELYQVEDETRVDQRRAEVGMEPLVYYLQRQGVRYVPPRSQSGGE